MNSDEEKALFTRWSWTYDHIARKWVSPDGNATVTTDELVRYSTDSDNEMALRYFVLMNCKLK